ncbi:S41 family peptidase [Marinimicrobium alkaliphilum]|uniref:S41 family peptidase n=1 Tax=Marinimicrobium alkaliphilum TaxID=2202654 RepID=UPI000DBA3132|nr:S41 family peptidase [Marinimicrobium alkaliphilum]
MLYAPIKSTLAILALALVPLGSAAEDADKGLLPLEDLRMFTRVFEHIRTGYVEDITDSQLLEYAIRGMIAELDPHSSYLDQSAFEDLQVNTTGEFGGLGIEVGMEDGFVRVIAPMDGTPAQKAGIEPGDLIIRLDDESVKGMSLNDAIQTMRGPRGSEITLTIVREGIEQPFEVVIERDIIKVQSVRTRIMEDDYLYLRIAQFQVHTAVDTVEAVTRHLREHPETKGLILDLRNNPGGVLQGSVDIVDAFLDEGLVVYTEGRLENSDIRYHAGPGDIANGLPMVVLINDGSASASEIVAGALQDHNRAVIMGTRSFGKGSVQTVVPISEDRAIKLTTARYFTPGGRSIQAQGIAPDVQVERARVTRLQREGRSEADLSGHLRATEDGPESTRRQRERDAERGELVSQDNQLHEALNLLKGLNIFQQQQARLAERQREQRESSAD